MVKDRQNRAVFGIGEQKSLQQRAAATGRMPTLFSIFGQTKMNCAALRTQTTRVPL